MTPEENFNRWHPANPTVYELFKKFTFEAIEAGWKNLGAKLIIERIRWETNVMTKGDRFKINTDFTAYYARLFMKDHPQYDGFFRTRKLTSKF